MKRFRRNLWLENALANSDKAYSETTTSVLLKVIGRHCLNFEWFKSFVSHGTSVMVGVRSRVATCTRLKADARIQSLISVHCVRHKQAPAGTNTLNDLASIKQKQNTLNTWRLLDSSNEKTAIFLKVQLEMNKNNLPNKRDQGSKNPLARLPGLAKVFVWLVNKVE